jgi:adenine deaminase
LIPGPLNAAEAADLVAVATRRAPADLLIRRGTIVNVYSEELTVGDVAVKGGRIAMVGADLDVQGERTEVIQAEGRYVLPGYIEPHCHPWALYNPDTLARAVLPLGNTALVGELLNLQLTAEPDAVLALYQQLQDSPMRWYWAVRVAGQSNEPLDRYFPVDAVERLLAAPGVVQIAEVTSWPRVLAGDPDLLRRTALAQEHGLRLDGHTAGATEPKVAAIAAAGFSADHESITYEEALTRLRLGYHVILRNSSLRPDLDALVELVRSGQGSSRISLTSDGSGPLWLGEHGMVDGLVRTLVRADVPIPRAVAMATLNPATYLRLDEHLGGIAPGRCADIQIVAEFDGRPPEAVLVGGRVVAAGGRLTEQWPPWRWEEHVTPGHQLDMDRVGDPATYRSPYRPGEQVPVMTFVSAGIARRATASTGADGRPGNALLAMLFTRDGRRRSWAWLDNFAPGLDGLAASYTTSGQFLVIGRNPRSMAAAARAAFAGAGGIAVASGTTVTARLELDIAGMMSTRPMAELADQWAAVEEQVKRAGYPFTELLYCLCFITCDFLPDLRLTADGLLEVKTGRILVPAEPLVNQPVAGQ